METNLTKISQAYRGLMDNSGQLTNNEDSIDTLCSECGVTFSSFLHQMADKNSKVVCPNCQQNRHCDEHKDSEVDGSGEDTDQKFTQQPN
jgi:protein-arginine kinase activator protein McsA